MHECGERHPPDALADAERTAVAVVFAEAERAELYQPGAAVGMSSARVDEGAALEEGGGGLAAHRAGVLDGREVVEATASSFESVEAREDAVEGLALRDEWSAARLVGPHTGLGADEHGGFAGEERGGFGVG